MDSKRHCTEVEFELHIRRTLVRSPAFAQNFKLDVADYSWQHTAYRVQSESNLVDQTHLVLASDKLELKD